MTITSDPVGVGELLQAETSQARFTELYVPLAQDDRTAHDSGRDSDAPTVEYSAGGSAPCGCW